MGASGGGALMLIKLLGVNVDISGVGGAVVAAVAIGLPGHRLGDGCVAKT